MPEYGISMIGNLRSGTSLLYCGGFYPEDDLLRRGFPLTNLMYKRAHCYKLTIL